MALDRAGVSVELHLVPDVPHGFDAISMQAPTSQRIITEYTNAITAALVPSAVGGTQLP
jgi:acetyl esterase/lipase